MTSRLNFSYIAAWQWIDLKASDYETEHEISLCREGNKRGIGCFQSNFN